MKECVQPYYVKDGLVHECSSFHMGLINEGKSIYEVARLGGTRLLFIDDHIDRLFKSLKLSGYNSWLSREEIHEQLNQLIRKNPVKEGNVKIVMNFRPGDYHHFLLYFVTHRYPSAEDYMNGVKLITYPFERTDPNKKVWRPEFRQKVSESIRQNGAFEALLLDSHGMVPEASKANVFGIKNGAIITPPDEVILPGITRKYVLNACHDLGIPVEMRTFDVNEIETMDALFLTGTSIQVLPVSQVNQIMLTAKNATISNIMKQLEMTIENHLG
ncbi:aminotransferase class IV [Bacteroidota bacterium]